MNTTTTQEAHMIIRKYHALMGHVYIRFTPEGKVHSWRIEGGDWLTRDVRKVEKRIAQGALTPATTKEV